jgi:(heptosyl)LPS beta-1,4-glucosyltransferase
MTTLSIVLIVKNESENITPCLESARFADELVVVDAGSEDDTCALAAKFTDRIFIESDWQGYGVQRQRAQRYATSEWILMLDADERITPELQQSIIDVVKSNTQDSVYDIARLSHCFGSFIRHSGWYPDYVTRLYPCAKAAYNASMVHEKLEYPANLKLRKLSGDLLHYTYRDIHHYLVKSAHYAEMWSKQRHEQGRRATLLQGALHAVGCFVRMYILRAGFLDGKQGLLLALLSGHSTFVKYADLWVRERQS